MDTIKRIGTFAGLLALILTLTLGFSSGGRVNAQDATPSAGNDSGCPNLADEQQLVVTGPNGQPVTEGQEVTGTQDGTVIVVREVKNGTINVYARCLGAGDSITATKSVNVWSGYPSLDYASHDACIQSQRDLNASTAQTKNWATGMQVHFDGRPVPPQCGDTSAPFRTAEDKEVVKAGTPVILELVDFGNGTIDISALVLEKDMTGSFTPAASVEIFLGYEDLEAAQADVCGQAEREARTAELENGWNAGFVVTVDGKPFTGC
jgi:hypothetical protein